jgi:ribosomal protein S18 acetylase RimI-like enzyme
MDAGKETVTRARALTEKDLDEVKRLRLRALQEHPLEFGADYDDEAAMADERWRERMAEPGWFGVEENGVLVACVYVRFPIGRKLCHNGWINAMYVAREAQGKGAADALMDAVESSARERGVTHLKLYARQGNSRAEAFYRRRGFVPYGIEPASHLVDGLAYHSLEFCKILPASDA